MGTFSKTVSTESFLKISIRSFTFNDDLSGISYKVIPEVFSAILKTSDISYLDLIL